VPTFVVTDLTVPNHKHDGCPGVIVLELDYAGRVVARCDVCGELPVLRFRSRRSGVA